MTLTRHPNLPTAIEWLLEDHVVSVGTLELLMLLRDACGRPRQITEICEALRCPRSWAELQLDALCRADLVEGDADSGFAYAPTSKRLARAVDDLARLWRRDPHVITRWLFSRPRASARRGRVRPARS